MLYSTITLLLWPCKTVAHGFDLEHFHLTNPSQYGPYTWERFLVGKFNRLPSLNFPGFFGFGFSYFYSTGALIQLHFTTNFCHISNRHLLWVTRFCQIGNSFA